MLQNGVITDARKRLRARLIIILFLFDLTQNLFRGGLLFAFSNKWSKRAVTSVFPFKRIQSCLRNF